MRVRVTKTKGEGEQKKAKRKREPKRFFVKDIISWVGLRPMESGGVEQELKFMK